MFARIRLFAQLFASAPAAASCRVDAAGRRTRRDAPRRRRSPRWPTGCRSVMAVVNREYAAADAPRAGDELARVPPVRAGQRATPHARPRRSLNADTVRCRSRRDLISRDRRDPTRRASRGPDVAARRRHADRAVHARFLEYGQVVHPADRSARRSACRSLRSGHRRPRPADPVPTASRSPARCRPMRPSTPRSGGAAARRRRSRHRHLRADRHRARSTGVPRDPDRPPQAASRRSGARSRPTAAPTGVPGTTAAGRWCADRRGRRRRSRCEAGCAPASSTAIAGSAA